MFYRLYIKLGLVILLSSSVLPVIAVEDEVRGLMMIIEQRLNDAAATTRAMQAGRNRALLCSYCHGEDGNSIKPEVPNLAGQNPVYLLDQINKFARGERENFVMNSLAKEFSLDDKVNLAIYFARQQVRNETVDEQNAAIGRRLFASRCASCHGEQGRGSADYARLAGQQSEYVVMTLRQFRANGRDPEQNGKRQRRSPIMESIARSLKDRDIEVLAAYLAGLD